LTLGAILVGMHARKLVVAGLLCAGFLPFAPAFTGSLPAARGDAPAAAVPSAPPSGQSAIPPSSDAEKHAKRTACLQNAKTKKLVGAEKTAFIKSCTAAP